MYITAGTLYKRGKIWWWNYFVNGKPLAKSSETKVKADAKNIRLA